MTVASIVFPSFQMYLDKVEEYDWTAENLRVALLTRAPNLGDKNFSDVQSKEVMANGYKAGGKRLKGLRVRQYGKEFVCNADSVVWTTRGITARHAVIYRQNRDRSLAVWVDFGAPVSAFGGWGLGVATFTVDWTITGVMKLSHKCCLSFPHEIQR